MKVLVVEDRGSFGPELARLTGEALRTGHNEPTDTTSVRWCSHRDATTLLAAHLEQLSLVVLDAFDLDGQQEDPTRSRLTSLDLIERIDRIVPDRRPDAVVYSTAMREPEVNVPLRYLGVAKGFYTVSGLTDRIQEIVAGQYSSEVPPPAPGDWAVLDPELPEGADVAKAHQLMHQHAGAWRQVWDGDAPFDRAAQRFVSRNVLPVLGVDSATGYALAVAVVQRIAGLPFRLVR